MEAGGGPLILDEETELARRAFLTQRQNPSNEGLTQWGVRAGCYQVQARSAYCMGSQVILRRGIGTRKRLYTGAS